MFGSKANFRFVMLQAAKSQVYKITKSSFLSLARFFLEPSRSTLPHFTTGLPPEECHHQHLELQKTVCTASIAGWTTNGMMIGSTVTDPLVAVRHVVVVSHCWKRGVHATFADVASSSWLTSCLSHLFLPETCHSASKLIWNFFSPDVSPSFPRVFMKRPIFAIFFVPRTGTHHMKRASHEDRQVLVVCSDGLCRESQQPGAPETGKKTMELDLEGKDGKMGSIVCKLNIDRY